MSGMLMPIGGAEDRRAKRAILNHFVQICGGKHARIAVIPSASRISHEVAAEYETIFSGIGAGQVWSIDFMRRQQADESYAVEALNDATGVFFTGGDQMRLLSLIGDTRFASTLRTKFRQGVHVAGTSAGASAISRHMIGFGKSGFDVSPHMVHMTSGLGLSNSLIIDQHFGQRSRLGRLISAVALHPHMLGIGLDEDTSLVIAPNGTCDVIGSGNVTFVNQLDFLAGEFERMAYQAEYAEDLAIYKVQSGTQLHISQAAYSA